MLFDGRSFLHGFVVVVVVVFSVALALLASRSSAGVAPRTPAGSLAPRAAAHLRPPHVLALQTLPLRLVVRPFRQLRRQLLAELVREPLAALPVLRAPLDERLARVLVRSSLLHHDRLARRSSTRAPRGEDCAEKLRLRQEITGP